MSPVPFLTLRVVVIGSHALRALQQAHRAFISAPRLVPQPVTRAESTTKRRREGSTNRKEHDLL